VRHRAPSHLRPYVFGAAEGWSQQAGAAVVLREVPFPGVPLVFDLGQLWKIKDSSAASWRRLGSFVAGLSTTPTLVGSAESWACIELRLTPLGAYRLLALSMAELTDRTVELEDVLPGARELNERLRDAQEWSGRFDLVDTFLTRRLDASRPTLPELEWAWRLLYRSSGRLPIRLLTEELGWSQRRLIRRFREQIGLAPKALARVIRFDRAVNALRSSDARGLADVAFDCGYADQAHLNREFREFAGITPRAFVAAQLDSGGTSG
jgi:AraC-like DNA-binding protein